MISVHYDAHFASYVYARREYAAPADEASDITVQILVRTCVWGEKHWAALAHLHARDTQNRLARTMTLFMYFVDGVPPRQIE